MENWSTFATVAGGAAAGLTGLLFVAVSIRIEVIAKSKELRNPVLLGIAGALLLFDLSAGLDLVVLPVIAALAGGVASAWLLLTKIPE